MYAGVRAVEGAPEGPLVRAVKLDVTKASDMDAALRSVKRLSGRLDILVNNAAVTAEWGTTLLEETDKDFDEALATNLRGAVLLTRRALPLLLARPGGRVVNVSSGVGSFAEGSDGAPPGYMVTKAALNMFTAYLHRDFAAQGLIANAVCPGWVRTDMGGPGADRSVEEGADTAVWLSTFAPGAPGGLFWRDREVIPW
jgi:NAD(P)-dependent dehydrogenase (short-subunit alcohol dehydrogenase family)